MLVAILRRPSPTHQAQRPVVVDIVLRARLFEALVSALLPVKEYRLAILCEGYRAQ